MTVCDPEAGRCGVTGSGQIVLEAPGPGPPSSFLPPWSDTLELDGSGHKGHPSKLHCGACRVQGLCPAETEVGSASCQRAWAWKERAGSGCLLCGPARTGGVPQHLEHPSRSGELCFLQAQKCGRSPLHSCPHYASLGTRGRGVCHGEGRLALRVGLRHSDSFGTRQGGAVQHQLSMGGLGPSAGLGHTKDTHRWNDNQDSRVLPRGCSGCGPTLGCTPWSMLDSELWVTSLRPGLAGV